MRWITPAVVAASVAVVVYVTLQKERSSVAEARAQLAAERADLATQRAEAAEERARLAQEDRLRDLNEHAQSDARALNDAIEASQRHMEEQRQRSLRAARLIEAFAAASQAKAALSEALLSNGKWPRDNREAGLPSPTDFSNERIHSLLVQAGGQIRVVLMRDGQPGESLLLTGSTNRAGLISWRCSSPDFADIEQIVPACKQQGEGS